MTEVDFSALAAKLDQIDKQLESLIVGRLVQQEPRPMSKRLAKKMRRKQEYEAAMAEIKSWSDYAWGLFFEAIHSLAELVFGMLLGAIMICIMITSGALVHPMLTSLWSCRLETLQRVTDSN
jgi:hypothetical protein